jgi:hypothetical protein
VKINELEIARALWDTGANCCCISYDLVKKLNLKPNCMWIWNRRTETRFNNRYEHNK